jgi:DNA-directed RNA polymerase specialized sigma24 family protein
MDALPRKGRGAGAGPDSPNGILEAYARIQQICLIAGLPPLDAEDVAQDVFLLLLRNGPLLALPAMPYLSAVVRNFIHNYRRERRYRRYIEGVSLAGAAEPRASGPAESIETNEMLDRVASVLPDKERQLLALIRSGYTIATASRMLKIPRGSRAYFGGRLVECARRELRARKASGLALAPYFATRCPKGHQRAADSRRRAFYGPHGRLLLPRDY